MGCKVGPLLARTSMPIIERRQRRALREGNLVHLSLYKLEREQSGVWSNESVLTVLYRELAWFLL
jgi:hypothetical protein